MRMRRGMREKKAYLDEPGPFFGCDGDAGEMRKTVRRTQRKAFLYSVIASLPKAKNATKAKVEPGTVHQRAQRAERIMSGVNRVGNYGRGISDTVNG
jgi:hypothetical protein